MIPVKSRSDYGDWQILTEALLALCDADTLSIPIPKSR
jgi:hypothetical protein